MISTCTNRFKTDNPKHGKLKRPSMSRGRPFLSRQKAQLVWWLALASSMLLLLLAIDCSESRPADRRATNSDQVVASSSSSMSKCPSKWIELNGRCFKIMNTPRSYKIAETRCHDLSAKLILVEDDSAAAAAAAAANRDKAEAFEDERHEPIVNNIISQLLASNNETNHQISINRQYLLNLSSELLAQFNERQQSGYYHHDASPGDASLAEHLDTGGPLIGGLWLPRDDPSITDVIYNFTDPANKDSPPVFALANSKSYKKWGIIPVSPNKKLAFICERIVDSPPPSPPREAASSPPHEQQQQQQPPGGLILTQDPEPPAKQQESVNQATPVVVVVAPPTAATSTQRDLSSKPEESSAAGQQPSIVESPSSMLFREYPQDQSVVMGSTAEMRCSPIDGKSSQISWTVNGKNLTQTNRVKFQPSGVLKIEHVRNTDSGNYTCTISSLAASSPSLSESRSARLDIIERPHQPDYITAELLDRLSTSVRVKWTPGFNGNSPIIKYQVEMKTVTGDSVDEPTNSGPSGSSSSSSSQFGSPSSSWEVAKANISADQTSVIVPDLKPAKKYIFRIRATNRVGTGDPSVPTKPPIEVPVQPPSQPPENLSGHSKTPISISIQWSPPPADAQNGAIKAYKVRHKLAGYETTSEWYTADVQESAHNNFVLDDLIVWQQYEIQVAAENDKGVGPFSPSIVVRTKEGRPDRGPQRVQADALTSSMIKITWQPPPPQHINGINQGYRVQVWSDARHSQLVREKTVAHSKVSPFHSATIDELLPYTRYYVTVKCYTSSGDGPANEEPVATRTIEDLPEQVAALEFADVLDKSLRLVWRPPNRINGELSHYTLEYSELKAAPASSGGGGAKRTITRRVPADATELRVTDLNPQTAYVFKLSAHTSVGQGPARSAQVSTTVPPVLPEPPSELTVSEVAARQATIHFNPGFDGNAMIDRWLVEALTPSTSNSSPLWQRIYVSTNHSQHDNKLVVRNLKPFTRYKIRLIPVNIVGESRLPSASTGEFQTLQVAPERPPGDLSIEDVKERSVLAHWTPLRETEWLGVPLGYNITWSEVGGGGGGGGSGGGGTTAAANSTQPAVSHFLVNDASADSFLIQDLEEFTEYAFRIQAVNKAGSSAASEPAALAITLEDVPSAGPSNLSAHAISSNAISVDWSAVPKRHRNGIIRGYKIQYQPVNSNLPLQFKLIEDNSTKHVTLNDLKPFSMYQLAVAAYTAAGDGVYSQVLSAQTLEDTPGAPQNLSIPTVSQTTARIIWDAPENPNGNITGYRVSYHLLTDSNKESAHELHENERTFKVTNLKPDSHYVFTVTAKTKEGWGQQARMVMLTHDSELRANPPFYKESWFVILCACTSVVITIIVTALLFIQTKSYKYKQDAIKSSTSQDRLGDAGFTIDDEPANHYSNNGFGLLSQGPSSSSAAAAANNHRRSNGALSQSTANFTLPKTPPRPQPGSVVYSDDEGDDDVFEDIVDKRPMKGSASNNRPGTSNYDDDSSGDSLTEKPSEISSSPAPDSDSADEEYANMADRQQYMNHYANVNGGTLRSQKSWKKGPKHYSSYRTKPKLPQRPVPSVPQVPGDPSSSSSENTSQGMRPGTSGMQSIYTNGSNSVYGESSGKDKNSQNQLQQQQQQQPPQPSFRGTAVGAATQANGTTGSSSQSQQFNTDPSSLDTTDSRPNTQSSTDMLNGHIVNLNGGRIIVDNMAGSRAPLPGFTSFV